jgi:hypothetical protein
MHTLVSLVEKLHKDQNYQELEKWEFEFKGKILELVDKGDYNTAIQSTLSLGLLLKYKPYGVKCSSLLGYSIFFLNPGEGFSFQRHLDFKTELFHFIDTGQNGYGFIAESDDFKAIAMQH